MKQPLTKSRPGLVKLKDNIEKNKRMVRKAAPVTGENKGMAQLEAMGDVLYQKAQIEKKRVKGSILRRLITKA